MVFDLGAFPEAELICAFFPSMDLVEDALRLPWIAGLAVMGRSSASAGEGAGYLVLEIPAWAIGLGSEPSAAVVGWAVDLAYAGGSEAYVAGNCRQAPVLV